MTIAISRKQILALFICSFTIRALVMAFFIQPHHVYRQADSFDYHTCAVSLAHGHGMYQETTKNPIFWRTPGYPLFLALIYRLCGTPSNDFKSDTLAHYVAIWLQIVLSSCIPLILFYLGLYITRTYAIALCSAWISVFHPGLVLASTYLLSEGIALLFFYLFLLYIYRAIIALPPTMSAHKAIMTSGIAAISLGIYTWIRPMGEIIGYFSTLLLISISTTWKRKLLLSFSFLVLFCVLLAPWYYRNYRLTGEYFFCPTIGTYVNCFSVPKILRRILHKPLDECLHIAQQAAALEVYKQQEVAKAKGLYVSNNVCKKVAFPIIAHYPGYFLYDWLTETIKTTFDLYTYQIIPMLRGTYWYDPIEEYVPQKIFDCLYAQQMPWYMRSLCWIELLYALLLWFGLAAGLWIFVIRSFITNQLSKYQIVMRYAWIRIIPMIALIIGMTGGFGYARLRLPAEPLLIILSLTYWYWFYNKDNKL